MKNIKIKVTTTNNAFIFGFGWNNYQTHEWRADLILGFIVIGIWWKRALNE